MLPCRKCAYRERIPGSEHTRCLHKWSPGDEIPQGNKHAIKMGWWLLPLNFDPVWGPDACVGFSETKDTDKTVRVGENPLTEILSILGGKRF